MREITARRGGEREGRGVLIRRRVGKGVEGEREVGGVVVRVRM